MRQFVLIFTLLISALARVQAEDKSYCKIWLQEIGMLGELHRNETALKKLTSPDASVQQKLELLSEISLKKEMAPALLLPLLEIHGHRNTDDALVSALNSRIQILAARLLDLQRDAHPLAQELAKTNLKVYYNEPSTRAFESALEGTKDLTENHLIFRMIPSIHNLHNIERLLPILLKAREKIIIGGIRNDLLLGKINDSVAMILRNLENESISPFEYRRFHAETLIERVKKEFQIQNPLWSAEQINVRRKILNLPERLISANADAMKQISEEALELAKVYYSKPLPVDLSRPSNEMDPVEFAMLDIAKQIKNTNKFSDEETALLRYFGYSLSPGNSFDLKFVCAALYFAKHPHEDAARRNLEAFQGALFDASLIQPNSDTTQLLEKVSQLLNRSRFPRLGFDFGPREGFERN